MNRDEMDADRDVFGSQCGNQSVPAKITLIEGQEGRIQMVRVPSARLGWSRQNQGKSLQALGVHFPKRLSTRPTLVNLRELRRAQSGRNVGHVVFEASFENLVAACTANITSPGVGIDSV